MFASFSVSFHCITVIVANVTVSFDDVAVVYVWFSVSFRCVNVLVGNVTVSFDDVVVLFVSFGVPFVTADVVVANVAVSFDVVVVFVNTGVAGAVVFVAFVESARNPVMVKMTQNRSIFGFFVHSTYICIVFSYYDEC